MKYRARPSITVLLLTCAVLAPAAAQLMDAPTGPVSLDPRGAWRIEQARSEPIIDKRRARLDLNADGSLVGHTSCNSMRGSYTLDGAQLKIGPIVTTRMACASLQLEQEDRILSALEAAATARVRTDGLLELRDAEGRGVLRATRYSETP